MRGDRLLSLLLLLQAQGRLTAHELADRLEVSERTIYRDLDALGAAGIPVFTERGPRGGAALLDDYRSELTGLTEEEGRALFTFAGPQLVADLGLGPRLEASLRKLMATLPESQHPGALRARQRVLVDAAGWMRPAEPVPHLGAIQEASWFERRLRLRYRGGDSESERVVDPYGLVAKAGVWYLVAGTEAGQRIFRVSRVESAEVLEEGFQRPKGFDLAAAWADSLEQFEAGAPSFKTTVRVAPEALAMLLRVLAVRVTEPIERVDAGQGGADGWRRLRLSFPGVGAARSALLQFGELVEVIDPEELRREIVEHARALLALYSPDRPQL
jgi:predicted DNA-binding transcriptional regulator YafY